MEQCGLIMILKVRSGKNIEDTSDDKHKCLIEKLNLNMENVDLKHEGNNANTMLSTVVVHAHPIIEMQLKNFKKDEVGYIAECVLYNKEFKEVESSFFIDEDRANEIIVLMQTFLNNCR